MTNTDDKVIVYFDRTVESLRKENEKLETIQKEINRKKIQYQADRFKVENKGFYIKCILAIISASMMLGTIAFVAFGIHVTTAMIGPIYGAILGASVVAYGIVTVAYKKKLKKMDLKYKDERETLEAEKEKTSSKIKELEHSPERYKAVSLSHSNGLMHSIEAELGISNEVVLEKPKVKSIGSI